jgi:mannosylglycoprotein endo-beta-mannosidase
MIGAFWNIRGLNKEGRLQCLSDFVKDNSLDFVGLQETKKEHFNESFLLYVHKDFIWHVLLAKGSAGGILIGFNGRKFEILACMNGDFCASVMIKNCYDKFVWRLIVIYGSPYEEGKLSFIQELDTFLDNWDGPTIIGGDFNLVSSCKKKNNGIVNFKWVDLFTDWINKNGLIELKPSNRTYTWTNNQEQPIMAAIDKFFCSGTFEQKFPLAFVSTKS